MQPAKRETTRKAHKEMLRQALELRESGMKWYEIADELGITPVYLSQLKTAYGLTELTNSMVEQGIDPKKISNYWIKSKHISIHVKGGEELVSYEDVRDDLISEMKKYAPKYPKFTKKNIKDPHLLVIDPADVHIGKLATITGTGEAYDHMKAVKVLIEGVEGLVDKSKGFELDKILLVIGNDILHVDTPNSTTTKGTYVQTSTTWHEAFKLARKTYVHIIERLADKAQLEVVYNPSNHDYMTGFMLTDALMCWFNNHAGVSFDGSILHRKYTTYGQNLICTSHGDGAREANLPMLMAQEASEEWGKTKYRYAYLHHIHHKKQIKYASGKDYIGVTIEYLRSPSASDEWHHKNGYVGVKKAIEAFVHHPHDGQVARFTQHVEF